jgi:hypothetical protein
MPSSSRRPCEQSSPLRLLIIVKRNSTQAWQEAWQAPKTIISCVLKHLKLDKLASLVDSDDSTGCRFMAVERWDSVVWIVCDLFNDNYKHDDAHLAGKNDLPVKKVYVNGGDSGYIIKARKEREIRVVGDRIREAHDMHGWEDRVPFIVDHADGACPVYDNPRSLLRAS